MHRLVFDAFERRRWILMMLKAVVHRCINLTISIIIVVVVTSFAAIAAFIDSCHPDHGRVSSRLLPARPSAGSSIFDEYDDWDIASFPFARR
jgi:hypothetical protein